MSFVRQSKFRHVFGSPFKADVCYNGLRVEGTGDTNSAVSGLYIAMVKGSKVFIVPLEKTGRQEENNLPYLDCKSKVLDVQWSPFHDDLLATGEETGDIRLWKIPDGGLKESISEPLREVENKHTRKITMLQWHPSADFILAACGHEDFVSVINMHDEVIVSDIPCGSNPTCIAWSYDGSVLGITSKEGKFMTLKLVNPRNGDVIVSLDECMTGTKPTKIAFLKNGNVLVVGCDKQTNREMCIYNKKDLEKIFSLDLDTGSAAMNLYYDSDLCILYMFCKGDTTVKYYEVDEASNVAYFLSSYSSTTAQKGGNFLPKRCVNTSTCEVARFYKFQPTKCEPISFIVPRKSEHFQKDIYVPCAAAEPALSHEEWIDGKNHEPLKMAFDEGGSSGAVKKEPRKTTCIGKKPAIAAQSAPSGNAVKNGTPPGFDINELLEDMKKVKATVRKLNKRVSHLEEMLEQQADNNCGEEEE